MNSESRISAAVREELSLLTPDDVCELLKVSKHWLYKEVELRGFPVVRMGNRTLRFRPAEVAAWVNGERAPEPAPKGDTVTPIRRAGRPRKA